MRPPRGAALSKGSHLEDLQEELGGLLEGFRQLHKEFSEEVRTLREETRAVRADKQGMQMGAQRIGAAVLGDGKDEQGNQPERRPWRISQVVDRAKQQFIYKVRNPKQPEQKAEQTLSGSSGSSLLEMGRRQKVHGKFLGIFKTKFQASKALSGEGGGVDPMERLNLLTMVVTICSLVYFGISIDYGSGVAWVVVEGLTVLYFVTELSIKIWYYNYKGDQRGYFSRKGAVAWNCVDAAVTFVQVVEYFAVLIAVNPEDASSYVKVSLCVRGLRVTRSLQEASIMRLPVLRDLTRMLVGFIRGLPSLLWVSLLIWVVIGIMAMAFRVIVSGDDTNVDLMEHCWDPESQNFKYNDDLCKPYLVLGNEYCGTVGECMFTVFRCILGDCTDTTGRSLVPILSEHYGLRFNITYAAGMIIVLLGIFNVVTAVFVESINEGIKEEELTYKKNHEWTGESVRKRLEKFCEFLEKKAEEDRNEKAGEEVPGQEDSQKKAGEETPRFEQLTWTADQLTKVFKDPDAKLLLKELDIDADYYVGTADEDNVYNQYNKYRLTDVFGIDEDGSVDAETMLSTIARMQGLAHMNPDIVNMLSIQQVQLSLQAFDERLEKLTAGPRETSRPRSPTSQRSAPAPVVIGVTQPPPSPPPSARLLRVDSPRRRSPSPGSFNHSGTIGSRASSNNGAQESRAMTEPAGAAARPKRKQLKGAQGAKAAAGPKWGSE